MTYYDRKFAWVDGGLDVAYRASAETQTLTLELVCDSEVTQLGVDDLVDVLRFGGAGGAIFAPRSVSGRLLRGDLWASAKRHAFELEVAGMDRLFVRWLIEKLTLSAMAPQKVLSLTIHGSLPLDASPLSIDTEGAKKWLRDPDAFPGQFAEPPFVVRPRRAASARQARMTIAFSRALTKKEYDTFHHAWLTGDTFVAGGLDAAGLGYAPKSGARLSRSGVELKIAYSALDVRPSPALDLWVNILHRFHYDGVPIERFDIALAGLTD